MEDYGKQNTEEKDFSFCEPYVCKMRMKHSITPIQALTVGGGLTLGDEKVEEIAPKNKRHACLCNFRVAARLEVRIWRYIVYFIYIMYIIFCFHMNKRSL